MNTNVLVTVVVSVVLCSVVSAGVSPQADAAETPTGRSSDGGLGGDISVFMQRGIATMNASVDSGMWREAFETAENHTRRQALVDERATVLAARLDVLEARIERFSSTPANRSVLQRVRRVRLVADRDALQTSVGEAKTSAASEGVNATRLDDLDRRLSNLTVSAAGDRRNRSTTNAVSDEPIDGTADDPYRADHPHPAGMTYGGP